MWEQLDNITDYYKSNDKPKLRRDVLRILNKHIKKQKRKVKK